MTDLNRRNFLFGTVASAAVGAAMVLRAPDEAVKLFQPTLEETVSITRIPKGLAERDIKHAGYPWSDGHLRPAEPGDILYNADGVPVCMVRSVNISHDIEVIDVTGFGADYASHKRGVMGIRVEMEVETIGPFTFVRSWRA